MDEFINRLNQIDTDRFVKKYVPLFILIGFIMLIATFLGPFSLLIMLGAIAAIVYFLVQSLK